MTLRATALVTVDVDCLSVREITAIAESIHIVRMSAWKMRKPPAVVLRQSDVLLDGDLLHECFAHTPPRAVEITRAYSGNVFRSACRGNAIKMCHENNAILSYSSKPSCVCGLVVLLLTSIQYSSSTCRALLYCLRSCAAIGTILVDSLGIKRMRFSTRLPFGSSFFFR